MPPHKSVGPADGSRETGVYNTMTNYHRGPLCSLLSQKQQMCMLLPADVIQQ